MSTWHKNNKQYRTQRRKILDAENWKCRTCGSYGNEVDHIKAVQFGGEAYDRDNLQVLCRGCHIEKTRIERGVSRSFISGSKAWDLLLQQLVT